MKHVYHNAPVHPTPQIHERGQNPAHDITAEDSVPLVVIHVSVVYLHQQQSDEEDDQVLQQTSWLVEI